jgi:hypothetical protein
VMGTHEGRLRGMVEERMRITDEPGWR